MKWCTAADERDTGQRPKNQALLLVAGSFGEMLVAVTRRGLIALACALALVVPMPATGQEEEPAAVAAALDVELTAAVNRYRAAQASANAAEGDRRVAENELVEVAVRRLVAIEEVQAAQHVLAITRFERVAAERALAAAEASLATQLLETYRFGGPAIQFEMTWRILSESRDLLAAARAIDELGTVVDYQSDVVDARRQDLADAKRAEYLAVRSLNEAHAELATASALETDHLAELERERGEALRSESALLAAIGNLFDTEQELIQAGADPRKVLKASKLWVTVLPPAEGDDGQNTASPAAAQADEGEGEKEEPIAMTERREWLDNRMGAHGTEQSVPWSDRAIREEWVCPLAYGTFANDYHFPRSHGRRHKGLDMFSTEGTPIVAIHSGYVVTRDESDHFNGEHDLGGVTVTIATRPDRLWGIDEELLPEDPGEPTAEWYYAHLQGISDGIDQHTWVEAGQVIGFVGDTGNARGTAPHLHLGHSVDGRSVNPYPSIAVACHSQRPLPGPAPAQVREDS